jgi:hypothetical protein
MPNGFTNKPRILRGAFVEYGLNLPQLKVVFQFNPLQLARNRSLSFSLPGTPKEEATLQNGKTIDSAKSSLVSKPARKDHWNREDLAKLRDAQTVTIQEETINFEIRLDATDGLNESELFDMGYGVALRLATLELMVTPKGENLVAGHLRQLSAKGFSFTEGENPPLVLFIWGRKRVLPVNLETLNITETEFDPNLNPIRATVAVGMTVIEGLNPIYMMNKYIQESMSMIDQVNNIFVTDVVIPG